MAISWTIYTKQHYIMLNQINLPCQRYQLLVFILKSGFRRREGISFSLRVCNKEVRTSQSILYCSFPTAEGKKRLPAYANVQASHRHFSECNKSMPKFAMRPTSRWLVYASWLFKSMHSHWYVLTCNGSLGQSAPKSWLWESNLQGNVTFPCKIDSHNQRKGHFSSCNRNVIRSTLLCMLGHRNVY